jgi:hypothetical protein
MIVYEFDLNWPT